MSERSNDTDVLLRELNEKVSVTNGLLEEIRDRMPLGHPLRMDSEGRLIVTVEPRPRGGRFL